MKIEADEKDVLESVERGEWKSAGGGKSERTRYSRYAKATRFGRSAGSTSGSRARISRRSRSARWQDDHIAGP